MSSNRLEMLDRQRTPRFDRQVGDAAVRIEHPSLDECAGRTRVEAPRAAAALLEPLRVRLEVEGADDFGEEQPRSDLRVDQAGVLANPAKTGVLRVDAFLHRTGVHVRTRFEWFASS